LGVGGFAISSSSQFHSPGGQADDFFPLDDGLGLLQRRLHQKLIDRGTGQFGSTNFSQDKGAVARQKEQRSISASAASRLLQRKLERGVRGLAGERDGQV
jgi:hypothetical protein